MYNPEACRRYYLAHREEICAKHREYMKIYREVNREKIKEKDQIYRNNNRAERNEYARIYYAKNKERILKRQKDNRKKTVWVFEVKHNEKVSFD